ncbi:hypothetical protein [Actinacidiphila glaucinigra]|uniref:hypothetical protein n=1 Tax=Actinacidiphila glaucinigra TaxID=235986 RepID=UPI0035D7558E
MSRRTRSTPRPSPPSPTSPARTVGSPLAVRDRDYLLDRRGVIFKVIGDVHPDSHYLGYVKYHPDPKGDRHLFGTRYRQNSVVSKSFGILADRPECYLYSPALGCVITGLPRQDTTHHYSARHALRQLHTHRALAGRALVGRDLLAVIDHIIEAGHADLFGITGSFLVGCHTPRSDIDLVCYGPTGYQAAQHLFTTQHLIRPYAGDDLTRLYLRRAKYMAGSSFDALLRQEQRKLQGLTPTADAHINCEPLRDDDDPAFVRMTAKEIGDVTLLARITDHTHGLATPALYGIEVTTILNATIDEPDRLAPRITHLRSYLGAYTGAFRAGDLLHIAGKLVHLHDGHHTGFGVELTPWSTGTSYLAHLTAQRP